MHAARRAVALGERVVLDYGTLAGARRAPRRCTAHELETRTGLRRPRRDGPRGVTATSLKTALRRRLGLAAVPVSAKLHGAGIGYILQRSGARVC